MCKTDLVTGFGKRAVSVALAALLIAALPAALPAPAMAQPAAASAGQTGESIHVAVNKSRVLQLDRSFSKAVIGNPEIADVVPLSTGSVYLLGQSVGVTNLATYDRAGEVISVIDVQVGPDAQGLARTLAATFPSEDVQISPAGDSLMLEGKVSDPLVAERIMAIAESYAPEHVLNMLSVGSPQQVMLEVRLSEMSRGIVKQLGIEQASWSNGMVERSIDRETGPFVGTLNGLFGSTLDVRLEALERDGLVRTLANPNLVTLSGEPASFLAGGEIPIPSGVDSNGRVTIIFKQFGVALAFTPTVLKDGMINMRVAPEVSSLDRDASIVLDGAVIPGLKVRRAVTTLELRDGQAFAMAGLLQSDYTNNMRRVPLLGRIPILGSLFRSTSFQRGETELVIMVTPRLVRPVSPEQIQLPTDQVGEPDDVELFLMGQREKRLRPDRIGEAG